MLLTFMKGILIGALVSAPMGPIGVLVIQRTLNKGRWHGFCSGIGAMASDIIYAIVAGMGVSFIMEFIAKHESMLQFAGSVLLFGFGLFTLRSNPINAMRASRNGTATYWQDFVTALFITLSNPFIIFLFIGLYTRLSFFHSTIPLDEIAVGIAGIAVGAIVWWSFITTLFGQLRKKFTLRRLFIMNRIVGSVIAAIALFGVITVLINHL